MAGSSSAVARPPPYVSAWNGTSVINWRWDDQFQLFTAATEIYDALAADQPPQATRHGIVAASLYPSIVNLTAAMGSPHWSQIAHSRRPDAFLDRVTEEVTEGWIPKGSFDPLRQWMTEDWLPGFRGSDTILPPKPQRLTPITK